MEWLKGKKTYILAILMAIVNGLYFSDKIDKATYDMLINLLGAGAVATVAAKVNRVNKSVDEMER